MAYRVLAAAFGLAGLLFLIYSFLFHRQAGSRTIGSRAPQVKGNGKERADVDYATVFPPSLRAGGPPDLVVSPGLLLKMNEDYRLADPSKYVYSGYSIKEIRRLGDFPDYAKLSGVPLPTPAPNFNLDTAAPRPYRPFRWNYHQTMAYYKLDADYWIELENTYRERIHQRQDLYRRHGNKVLRALPGTELACKELMEMTVQFICARYPRLFQLEGGKLVNHILGTTHDLTTLDPLHVLLDNVPEDFALMLRDETTGRYIFRAGVICSSIGWNLESKIGLGVAGIHTPVPDFKEKLTFSLDRFFVKMQPSQPIERGSWGLEIGQPLYLPGDDPAFAHRDSQDPNLGPDEIHLRVDWQTLRRLPLSGAVCFNYRALFTPISEFRDEPYVPSLVHKVLSDGKESLMKYKGTWHVEHVAKPVLREYEKFQVAEGLMEPDWEPQTLKESPFYPDWKQKWVKNGGINF